MIDRPFDQIRDVVRANNQKSRELTKYVFEKSDALSLWLIGLSIGGIGIFASNVLNIKKSIGATPLAIVLILLSISVVAGIIYRNLWLYWFIIQNNISDCIDFDFSREKKMHMQSFLTGNETYQELINTVFLCTGIDYGSFLPVYDSSDDSGKQILYDSMVTYYLNSVEFAKKDYELGVDFMVETLARYSGLSKEKFIKVLQNQNWGVKHRKTIFRIKIFYWIFTSAFIIALFLFVISVI